MRRSTVSIWGLTLLLGGAVVVQAQQQPEERPPAGQPPPPVTFRVEVNYVEVDAIVNDAQGNFVGDLTKDDFQILENLQDERSSDELGGARGGYGYTAEVPLRDIAPGLYVLKVEARSRLQGGGGVSREVLLRVRDRAAGSD